MSWHCLSDNSLSYKEQCGCLHSLANMICSKNDGKCPNFCFIADFELNLLEKWIWTILHQLCQWKASTNLHWVDTESRAGEFWSTRQCLQYVMLYLITLKLFFVNLIQWTALGADKFCVQTHVLLPQSLFVINCYSVVICLMCI